MSEAAIQTEQTFRAVDIIRRKRDGHTLTAAELHWFCQASGRGEVPDYQASAFLMASYFRGMTDEETAWFTDAMMHSGDVVDLSDVPGVKVDKHSTGGVGDTTTLIVGPLAAACGLTVAKMSGRGLGHTGGTLDKLESIPNLTTSISLTAFKDQVRRIGLAVISQTTRLVPADSRFYALRDVTATVESIPLIASSVMSKKLASGADVILLDVKCGRGAFMRTVDQARQLARLMVAIGTHLGRRVRAVISRMESPLGRRIGNALEVQEAIEILQGQQADGALCDVSLTLTSHLLVLAGHAPDLDSARALAVRHLQNGDALERFRRMIEAQGGEPRVVDDVSLLPQSRARIPVLATSTGRIHSLDALEIGDAAMWLGAGRQRKEDSVDAAVGVVLHRNVGDAVERGDMLAELYVNDARRQEDARRKVLDAFQIADGPCTRESLIIDTV